MAAVAFIIGFAAGLGLGRWQARRSEAITRRNLIDLVQVFDELKCKLEKGWTIRQPPSE